MLEGILWDKIWSVSRKFHQANSNAQIYTGIYICKQAFNISMGSQLAASNTPPSTKTAVQHTTTVLSKSPNGRKTLSEPHQKSFRGSASTTQHALLPDGVLLIMVVWGCSENIRQFEHVVRLYTTVNILPDMSAFVFVGVMFIQRQDRPTNLALGVLPSVSPAPSCHGYVNIL